MRKVGFPHRHFLLWDKHETLATVHTGAPKFLFLICGENMFRHGTKIRISKVGIPKRQNSYDRNWVYPLDDWEKEGAPYMSQLNWCELIMRICTQNMTDLGELYKDAEYARMNPDAPGFAAPKRK